MVDYAEKAQHLRRCSTHNIRKPRVACTIVWQPWAIKNATPTALKHSYNSVINSNIRMNKDWIAPKRYNAYSVVPRTTYAHPG